MAANWEPQGFLEPVPAKESDKFPGAIWQENETCSRIQFKDNLTGIVGWLSRHKTLGVSYATVSKCECAPWARDWSPFPDSGGSVSTVSGGLPTLGRRHR